MKILMINVVCGIRSTGRICTDLAAELEKQGHEVKIAYGRGKVPEQFHKYAVRVGTDLDVYMHALKSRLFDSVGFESKRVTKKFVSWIREYDPDVIHLHNLHGYYINVEILFQYLKECGKKIIWTLHDCWAFTGHCTHFDYIGCDKWKKNCTHCPQKKEYPASCLKDNSYYNFRRKKDVFQNIPNMILVTPSNWLKTLISQSFLRKYPVNVIHNGIDTSIFKPVDYSIKERLRQEFGILNKTIILGVASVWNRRKGLDVFVALSKLLPGNYQIVLIGVDKKQAKKLPDNIITIARTNNTEELAAWYSTADIFVNPTLEDTYPTVNLEAIACGTPVITFDTGGSPESALLYGKVVERGNTGELLKEIKYKKNMENKKIKEILEKDMLFEYIDLYNATR